MQILFNGLISGSSIALLAVAFQLVYLPTRIFFVGLAGLYSLAPYLALAASRANLPMAAALLVSVAGVVAAALLCERVNHSPLRRKTASGEAHLISSLGIYIVLVQVIVMVWGNDTKSLRIGSHPAARFGGVVLTGSQLLMVMVACLLLAGVWAVLRASDIGLRLRALADNPVQFALFGCNSDAHRLAAFALAGAVAAADSLLAANDTGFDPYTGLHTVLLAVVAVIVGGRFSFLGPAVGGFLLGLVRAQVVWHFSARWEEAITFACLGACLLLRPDGLFGRPTRARPGVA